MAGAFLAEDVGWRWVFWVITIAVSTCRQLLFKAYVFSGQYCRNCMFHLHEGNICAGPPGEKSRWIEEIHRKSGPPFEAVHGRLTAHRDSKSIHTPYQDVLHVSHCLLFCGALL